ncbi:hypothetical protein SSX86_022639 [Deinandra increscens subsp. villosa]|uniref:pyruvate decarboxylase n=1 Tax=Deinandra increscens subsp. villosa TaxID=3103831 RepID=A0AAP0CKW5_9ASTR
MDAKTASLEVVPCPNGDVVSALPTSTVPFSISEATLGRHLARRLVQIGVSDVFSVPGDFNLTLLDLFIAEPGLNLIGCCNELNAGYAADGYARSRGVGACVVTFDVGGLSVLNAIAGAYSENLPLICIVGGPNSNDYGSNRILHHTIGLPDFSQELRCFQTVTCYQAVVKHLEDAHELIDTAISTALKESKPEMQDQGFMNQYQMNRPYHHLMEDFSVDSFSSDSYTETPSFIDQSFQTHKHLEEPVNIKQPFNYKKAGSVHKKFNYVVEYIIYLPAVPAANMKAYPWLFFSRGAYAAIYLQFLILHFTENQFRLPSRPTLSNQMGLEAAIEAAAEFLKKAVKSVMVGGPKLRVANACKAFVEMADSSGYAFAVMPSGKGLVPEHHPHFIGTYWGSVSTSFCAEIIESADAYLFAGPIFNDFSSVGYSLSLNKEKAIILQPDRVVIGNGPTFGCVLMKDFLQGLAKRIKKNTTAYDNYYRIYVPEGHPMKNNGKEALRTNVLFGHIQNMLSADTAVIAETGDSWFNCQKLKLPKGCGYEFQMQYGSIGWSVGATLGYAQAATSKRVIACIGDGSFQVTAQDLSTMLRCGQKSIIFLINNGGYTIEVEMHDGPYNEIKNWNYTGLVDAIHNGEGKCWTSKVFCEEELVKAIETTSGEKQDCLCFIEVILHRDDTSKELLIWAPKVNCVCNGVIWGTMMSEKVIAVTETTSNALDAWVERSLLGRAKDIKRLYILKDWMSELPMKAER